jgi:signal transduction histidine kinase
LSLSAEVILNISLLMMVAILLIGFTLSKFNEKSMIQEKIINAEGMVHDFQVIIDYLSKDKKDFSWAHPFFKKEIQELAHIYSKERGLYDLVIVDQDLNVIAGERKELWDKRYPNHLMKDSIQSGHIHTEVETSGSFISKQYKKLILYSPLWFRGKMAGGIQMDIPIGDVTIYLLESQKVLFISILLDAIVLIVFGNFLISRVLVKPLKDLVRLTQKISEGDFSQKIEGSSRNEIGQLISSFNRMIEKLKENQESLDRYLKSLESANRKLKQAQEELIRSEKMASVGRLAAGVAHEVGNPLGTILGYMNILEKEGMDQEEAKDYLRRIEKEIERINRIIRGLLDFARPPKFVLEEVEINGVIENTIPLLIYQKSIKNIETVLRLQPNLPMINGDESQLSQILINMMLNAIDAMPKGGLLKIETEEYVVENLRKAHSQIGDLSSISPSPPLTLFSKGDRWVRIRISDSGIGIKKEDMERIFDPFFTTKSPDKGTGLGLSISLRMVESMGGAIRVESEYGKGATFEIYFPALGITE